jgi:hypothetical protein
VVRCERRRHGLHHDRNFHDKVFSDAIAPVAMMVN